MEVKKNEFTIDKNVKFNNGLDLKYSGFGNNLSLDLNLIITNIRNIQLSNRIELSKRIDENLNFTIEMETGTGKIYVYTKTMLELNKVYGFTKFIIVVPSIAIKEGVLKSLQITKEHFAEFYNNVTYRFFTYDSSNLNQVFKFANNTNIEIMIINIDSFKKSFEDIDKESKANIIHRPSDALSGNKPIDLIKDVKPIVIIDEPQSIGSEKSKLAIKSLKPLFTVGYSATHKEKQHLMFQLSPVDAFLKNIVKQIQVSSIRTEQTTTLPYINLLSVNSSPPYASLEIFYKLKDGSITKKQFKAKVGTDLWELSNKVEVYENKNFTISDIDTDKLNGYVSFSEGTTLKVGQRIGQYNQEDIKRAQLRETIRLHLRAER
jgi:type III restriction enzyme